MKTITISITVPDDAKVGIVGAGAYTEQPFVAQPDPPYPDVACPVHGTGWRLIKGGFSKTKLNPDGTPKRFNAFYACETKGCDERPPRDQAMTDLSDPMPF